MESHFRPNVPEKAVVPLCLEVGVEKFSLSDARVLLGDFDEVFPVDEFRRGDDCHIPLPMRPPETCFEPQAPHSYPADIWGLALIIWEILGMKIIFGSDFVAADEVTSQQVDALGPMPSSWWTLWEKRDQFFSEDGHPKEGRSV